MKNSALKTYKEYKASTIPCPKCGSENTEKAHRSFFEKLLSEVTFGRIGYRKYYCYLCDSYSSVSKAEVDKAAQMRKDQVRG